MNEILSASAAFGVVVSLLGYLLGMWLKKRFRLGIFNPLLVAVLFVIGLLLLLGVDYETYYDGAKYLSWLLTPATVSLAIPLYVQLDKLKKNLAAILISVSVGVLSSLGSVLALAALFRLDHASYVTLLPKSITTAIGMDVSQELEGYVPITVAVIVLTGIFGNAAGDLIFRLFRVTDPIAKGLGIGTASHAIGTARAMEWGELEGAMSSLAIVVSGLLTVLAASLFAQLL